MSWDRVNQMLQIISNVGVVLGLVLVAAQMNQTTEAIRLQNYQSTMNGFIGLDLAAMGDTGYAAQATALLHPSEMTEEQIQQYWYVVDAVMTMAVSQWRAVQSGQATESDWSETRRELCSFLGNPAARVIWDNYKSFGFPQPFIDEIDAEFSHLPREGLQTGFQTMVARMRTLGK
jgi:hypothetical protein